MDESRQKPSFPQPSGAWYPGPPAASGSPLPVPCGLAPFAPAPWSSAPCRPAGLKYGPSKSLLLTRPRSGCERPLVTRPWLGFRQAVRARPWRKRQEPGPADPKRYLLALTAQANEPFFLTMPTRQASRTPAAGSRAQFGRARRPRPAGGSPVPSTYDVARWFQRQLWQTSTTYTLNSPYSAAISVNSEVRLTRPAYCPSSSPYT